MSRSPWGSAARSVGPTDPDLSDQVVQEGQPVQGLEVLASHPAPAAPPASVEPDTSSFDEFYARELPRLVAFAQALCGRPVADDVAQEAMIAAYRRWSEVSRYTSPEAWVRRVCANQATSVLRRRAAEARAVLRMVSREPVAELEAGHQAFWDEVRRLPKRQAQATALRYVYGLSVAEVASTLGCTEGSAKVHLTRARSALAARLVETEEPS
jgi:RNA polymerase sigma-70 factor (ECF subfamily)